MYSLKYAQKSCSQEIYYSVILIGGIPMTYHNVRKRVMRYQLVRRLKHMV